MRKRLPVPNKTQVLKNGSKVHWRMVFYDAKGFLRVPVTCGECKKRRIIFASHTRGKNSKIFTGYCYPCNLAVQRRTYHWKPGPHHPEWRGGHFINQGYAFINIRALTGKAKKLALQMARTIHGKPAIISEHRLIMALHLDRPLKHSEVIHHRDGNKLNNDISNLEITNHADHRRLDTKYYRLWQDALKRITELELELERFRNAS